jgi:hypothetical protein
VSEPEPLEVRGLVRRYGTLTAVAGVDIPVRAGALYAVPSLFADYVVFLRRDLAGG